MNVTRALGVGLSLWMLSACGEEKLTPCSGDNCLDVAGTYSLLVHSPAEANTCKHIRYTQGDDFPLSVTVTQNGSEVDYSINDDIELAASGTLFDNGSATFKKHLDHVTVHGSTDYDYAADVSDTFVFTRTEAAVFVSGSLSVVLNANADPVPDDQICALSASFNGQR